MNSDVQRRWRSEGRCAFCGVNNPETYYCAKCNEKKNVYARQLRLRIKTEIIQAYGGKCACCGDNREYYLQLDHIDGGGNEHRRELGLYSKNSTGTTAGYAFYLKMRKQGYPPILQVLCANCHQAKTLYGGCPSDAHGNVS